MVGYENGKHEKIEDLENNYLNSVREIERYLGVLFAQAEILAYLEASKYVDLTFIREHNNPGFDAFDQNKLKVEIKGASYGDNPGNYCTVFNNWKKKDGKFHYAVLVSFNHKFDVKFVLKMSEKLIKKYRGANGINISNKLAESEKNNPEFHFFHIAKDIRQYFPLESYN